MANHNMLYFIKTLQMISLYPCIVLAVILSSIWNVFFNKRLVYLVKVYRNCLKKARTNPIRNFPEETRNYKIEIVTKVFLLIINVTEFAAVVIYALGGFPVIMNHSHSSNTFLQNNTLHNCSNELHLQTIDLKLALANPLFSILVTIAHVCLILSIASGICLVKYLHIVYHEMNIDPFKFIKRFLIMTIFVGIIITITGSVPQLMFIEKFVGPIILFVYLYIWIKNNITFYKTLRWRSIEFKVRGYSNRTVKNSVISYRQFMIIMSCMFIIASCFALSELITQYFFLIATVIYDGPCLFNYLYGTAFYKPLLTTQKQIDALELTNKILSYITTFLVLTASVLLCLEYTLATFVYFGRILWKKLKTRFCKIRTRFTPRLSSTGLQTGLIGGEKVRRYHF